MVVRKNQKQPKKRVQTHLRFAPEKKQLKKRTTLLWREHSFSENDNVDSSSNDGGDGGD